MAVRKIPISEYYYRKREIDAFLNGKSDDDHTHGNIGNNGAVNSDTDAVNKIVVTDSSNMIKTINTLPLDKVTHQDISGKVNTSDIKNDLTSTDTDKPLSASQGNVLKGLVDSKATNTHNHGNINNNGTITTETNDVNKIMVTDSSDTIKTIDTLPANKVIHQDISGKVNTSDIKNNLTSTDTDKPLSAKQGNELKTLVDSKANSNDVYTKNETMSAEDIRSAIAESIGDIDIFEVVSALPTSNIKKNKFYLTPNGENIEKNVYDINIYINNKWETIDSLEFDISNYPTKSEITILLNGKVDKIDGKQLSTNDFTNALKNKLENQVLTQHQSLANYIQKSQTQGLVKNDGTIDTNEYLTIETMPKPFNYGFIDSDLVLHIMYIGTEISVTKTIMQNGENNPITVIVSDEKGNLLEDMPVEFYIDGVKVGQTINTNSNGVASYTYQGNGSGKIEVQVKIGSFVSQPYEVIDALWFDDTSSSSSTLKYYVEGDNSLSYSNGEITYTVGSSAKYIKVNGSSGMTSDIANYVGKTVRFEVDVDPSYQVRLVVYQKINNQNVYSPSSSSVGYVSTAQTLQKDITIDANATQLQFRIDCNNNNQNETVKFKNCKVYPI